MSLLENYSIRCLVLHASSLRCTPDNKLTISYLSLYLRYVELNDLCGNSCLPDQIMSRSRIRALPRSVGLSVYLRNGVVSR